MGADGKIYVVAGCKHGPAYWMERTIRLDPDAVAAGWELWSPLQPARGNSRVILGHDGFIYSIGGDVEWCFSTNSVEKLDTRRPVGDINGDTVVDFGDIDPFVGLLSGP